ncbi:hypothetical protein [Piscirickettsia salmonis]|uniref:hypothetical protein n=1 Tax=Piscirickettsia salmonis TaxID=1238 RepID=UPI0007C8AA5C|nr:hypothetical protein A0O36_02363 [Piscirickettsiaceae bacterium NZ-RLO1]
MPKFHKSFYLSFHADYISSIKHQNRKLYFYQKDKNLERQYTIDMYTGHRRKSLLNDQIPFVRLNFPYMEDAPTKWQVDTVKTNAASQGVQSTG